MEAGQGRMSLPGITPATHSVDYGRIEFMTRNFPRNLSRNLFIAALFLLFADASFAQGTGHKPAHHRHHHHHKHHSKHHSVKH